MPGAHRRLAGQQAQLLLPVTQGIGIAAVDFHRREQGLAAVLAQPLVQALGKPAEVLVLAVAESQHGIVQAIEA